jgi:hypothetical protein
LVDEHTEIAGQLRRSLILLGGCDDPAARAQIAHMRAGLHWRLQRLEATHSAECHAAATRRDLTRWQSPPVNALECAAYAIQCEWLASLVRRPDQRACLSGLARLWRGLGTSMQE